MEETDARSFGSIRSYFLSSSSASSIILSLISSGWIETAVDGPGSPSFSSGVPTRLAKLSRRFQDQPRSNVDLRTGEKGRSAPSRIHRPNEVHPLLQLVPPMPHRLPLPDLQLLFKRLVPPVQSRVVLVAHVLQVGPASSSTAAEDGLFGFVDQAKRGPVDHARRRRRW